MDESFNDVLVWGVIFIVLIVILFLGSKILKSAITSDVRGRGTLFGMGVQDVENLKEKGALTPEEAKAVRAAMSRRLLERVQAEQKAKELPPRAEIVLGAIDKEAALRMKAAEAGQQPPAMPVAKVERPVSELPPEDELPVELQSFLRMSQVELDDLCAAGFLSAQDVERIRRMKAKS